MPLYEYHCKNCNHRFEKIRKFSDSPIRDCPKCGKPAVEQLISTSSAQFKGTGWYVTDYARKGSKQDASAPAASGASGEKGDSPAPAASGKGDSPASASSAPASKAEVVHPAGSAREKKKR